MRILDMNNPAAPVPQLLFFSPALQFMGDLATTDAGAGTDCSSIEHSPAASGEDRAALHTRARYLVWLMTRNGSAQLSVYAHLASRCSSAQSLRQMVSLVKQAERLEREGRVTMAADAWSWLDRELPRMRSNQRLQGYLEKVATRSKIATPWLTAHTVRIALAEELLPLLHAKWYLLSCKEQRTSSARAAHENYLVRWRFSREPDISVIRVYAASLIGFAEARRRVTPEICANMIMILGSLDPTTPEYFQVVQSFVRLVRSSVDARLEHGSKIKTLGSIMATRFVRSLGKAVSNHLPSLRLAWPSRVENRGDEWIECARVLAHILALNPLDENAYKTLKYLSYHLDVRITRAWPRAGWRIEERMRGVFKPVAVPPSTERARCCRAYTSYEAARRLGVDIFDAAGVDRVVKKITEAAEQEMYSGFVHTKFDSWNQSLDAFPWARLPKNIAQGWISSTFVYLSGLPNRREASLASRVEQIGLTSSRGGESPRPGRAQLSRLRLLAAREAWASLHGAIGITLIAIVLLVSSMREHMLTAHYERVLQSVRSRDDVAVVEHARRFLGATSSSDPRIRQVTSFADEALLRCVVGSISEGARSTALGCLDFHTSRGTRGRVH
jgi:hypothetical protein